MSERDDSSIDGHLAADEALRRRRQEDASGLNEEPYNQSPSWGAEPRGSRDREPEFSRGRTMRQMGPHRRGTSTAGATLMAMLLGFFVAGLLDVAAIEQDVAGRPLGAGRTVQLALLKPMVALSEALRFDRPAAALNMLMGRGEQRHHTLADVAPVPEPKWPREVTVEKPLRLLIVGDSMAQALGPSLKNLAQADGAVKAKLDYKVSSGLSRPDFFDWPQRMIDQLVEVDPDATIVMFGANDAQDLRSGGRVLHIGSSAWRRAYQARIKRAIEILTRGGRRVYWVGNPIMRDGAYGDNMAMINHLYEAEAGRRDAVFYVDTWDLLADGKGRYAEYLRDKDGDLVLVRGADGIHFTRPGADMVAAHIMTVVEGDWSISSSNDGTP